MVPALLPTLARSLADRRGVTAAEYAVIALGIVLIVAVAAQSLGDQLTIMFSRVTSAIG